MSGTQNTNPGNFANRYVSNLTLDSARYRSVSYSFANSSSLSPKEEVRDIASKGGQASHSGGFASMDPDKQVCTQVVCWSQVVGI
jgi:hypothetical protein